MYQKRLENLLGALALSINDVMAEAISQQTTGYGSDSFALVLLSQTKTLRCDELAKQLGLAPSSVVRLVDRLEQAQWVQRSSGEDKRTVMLSLTMEGEQQAKQILAARRMPLEKLVAQLCAKEQHSLCLLTEKLLTALTPDALRAARNCRLCDETACELEHCPVERCWQQYQQAV